MTKVTQNVDSTVQDVSNKASGKTVIQIHPVSDSPATNTKQEKTPSTNAEIGGRKGLDPTRYGDWEKNGRCIDF